MLDFEEQKDFLNDNPQCLRFYFYTSSFELLYKLSSVFSLSHQKRFYKGLLFSQVLPLCYQSRYLQQ